MDWLLYIALVGWLFNPMSFKWVREERNPDWLITELALTVFTNILVIPACVCGAVWACGEVIWDRWGKERWNKFKAWRENRNRARIAREVEEVNRELRERAQATTTVQPVLTGTATGISAASALEQAVRVSSQLRAQEQIRQFNHLALNAQLSNAYRDTLADLARAREAEQNARLALSGLGGSGNIWQMSQSTISPLVAPVVTEDTEEGFDKASFLKEGAEFIKETKGQPKS